MASENMDSTSVAEQPKPSPAFPQEPQLKYEGLASDVPTILQNDRVSCLCLSDKILALGTEKGRVHVLDYSGNEVRRMEFHRGRVTELAFDGAEEHLASASDDTTLAIASLYTDTVVRHECKRPVKALALDPRYAARKSKEVVWAGASGALQLSSQGWLGRSETPLPEGSGGAVQVARWWGSLIAWVTPKALMVYCTTQHHLVRTIPRPSPAAGSAAASAAATHARASLLFGQNGYLYASWPDCIKVARSYSVENSVGTLGSQVEVMAELRLPHTVLGVSPFGRDLAVLTLDAPPAPAAAAADASTDAAAPSGGSSTGAGGTGGGSGAGEAQAGEAAAPAGEVQPGAATPPPVPPALKATLRIVTTRGAEAAADELPLAVPQPPSSPTAPYFHPISLVPSLPATTSDATAKHLKRDYTSLLPRGSLVNYLTVGWQQSGYGAASTMTDAGPQSAGTQGQGQRSTGAAGTRGSTTDNSAAASPAVSVPHSPRASHRGPGSSAASIADSDAVGRPEYGVGAEYMYFVAGPEAVLVGRTRDADDRCAWLLSVGRYADALALAEEVVGFSGRRLVKQETYDKVVSGVIADLLGRAAYAEAAALSRRLLRDNVSMWERWVYVFAQARQLPRLAPHVPTDHPKLRHQVYDLVLHSLLPNPADHTTLLQLVRTWPAGLYSATGLVDAVVARMKRPASSSTPAASVAAAAGGSTGSSTGAGTAGGETRELWLLLSHLYERQGRPDLSLAILLQLGDPSVFSFLDTCGAEGRVLPGLAGRGAAQLVAIDEAAALRVLVRAVEVLPPSAVVPGLEDAAQEAGPPGSEACERWRKAMWRYLSQVTTVDSQATAEYHLLLLKLTADYAPGSVMEVLAAAGGVALEDALGVCEERGMVAEQVYILGRMGARLRALRLIINQLADIPQAIEFVRESRDEELWEHLITWALSSPNTTGALLDHIGGHINPLAIVKRIPKGTEIPRLRDRLRAIIADFRTQTSLREGCNVILRSDCAHLVARLYAGARSALPTVYVAPGAQRSVLPQQVQAGLRHAGGAAAVGAHNWVRYEAGSGAVESMGASELPGLLQSVAEHAPYQDRDVLAPQQPPVMVVCTDVQGEEAAISTSYYMGSEGAGGRAGRAGAHHGRSGASPHHHTQRHNRHHQSPHGPAKPGAPPPLPSLLCPPHMRTAS